MAGGRILLADGAGHAAGPVDAVVRWAAESTGRDWSFPPMEEIVLRIVARQPQPTPAVILATGLLALALVVGSHAAAHVTTLGHEGGHALVALLLGAGVSSVVISTDTSGATRTRRQGASVFLFSFAGYVGPPLFGLGGAAVLAAEHATALLWIAVALLVALLVKVRNAFGVFVVVLAGGVLLFVAAYAKPDVHILVAYVGVWFLLMAGFPDLTSFGLARKKGSDFQKMRDLTWVPGVIWMLMQLGVAVVAFYYGARMLLRG